MSLLHPILLPKHDQIEFRKLRGTPPNRICFSGAHQRALKENAGQFAGRYPFKFSVPFDGGVLSELRAATDVVLRKSDYGYWSGLGEEDAEKVRQWMLGQGSRVYLKDFFDRSISLSQRTNANGETEVGALFTAAKYHDDAGARIEIASRLKSTWNSLISLPKIGVITCPPPRAGKTFDLPSALAERLAKHAGLPFVQMGKWLSDKGQLKEVPADKKWDYLHGVGFGVNPQLLEKAGHVLVIDDIYQSGTTINFLRSRLTASGVARASAISIVKAARDTDNQ
jgi:predicted amidophosphoribosyltransferase